MTTHNGGGMDWIADRNKLRAYLTRLAAREAQKLLVADPTMPHKVATAQAWGVVRETRPGDYLIAFSDRRSSRSRKRRRKGGKR